MGFALANLIDLQRREQVSTTGQAIASHDIVSADMLYHLAAYHDRSPDHLPPAALGLDRSSPPGQEGVRSLRSAIKALYHHGVCRDIPCDAPIPKLPEHWQSDCYRVEPPFSSEHLPTVAQARAAREITLGAYYRLDPVLNDYHAALNDAGGVLVSALVHEGWRAPFAPSVDEVGDGFRHPSGAHAFVLVGYCDRGFLVLNSWGERWGGAMGLEGVGIWTYPDWAETVMDGWVLRLGVPTSGAFDATLGRQGLSKTMKTIRRGQAPCHQVIGHYLHLDDGFHVEQGPYPSDRKTWSLTRERLEEILPRTATAKAGNRPRKGILLWIAGSFEGIGLAMEAALVRKRNVEARGLYPYHLFWCNSFTPESFDVLTSIADSAYAQVGALGPTLDALIETKLRGVGRAFWRDIKRGARRAALGPSDGIDGGPARASDGGPAAEAFLGMLDLANRFACELHVVCEGAGALVLDELLQHLGCRHRSDYEALPERLTTLSLVHPAVDLARARHRIGHLVSSMNERQEGSVRTPVRSDWNEARDRSGSPPRARIYLPGPQLEQRISFGAYGGSLLQLVSRSFEDRLEQESTATASRARTRPSHPPRPMLGMRCGHSAEQSGAASFDFALSELSSIAGPGTEVGRVAYSALLADPQIEAEIYHTIEELRVAARQERAGSLRFRSKERSYEMTRITTAELMERLRDLSAEESEFKDFFIIDPQAEDAFRPAFKLNPETVEIPEGPQGEARSAQVLNLANWFARMSRYFRFFNRMSGGYAGPVIVAEGDSWWQYPILLEDTIDHLSEHYAIRCVSSAGDLLGNMATQAEYLGALRETNASILLLSGGGNDMLLDGQLARHLEDYDEALKPTDYLKPSFQQVLTRAFGDYERILRGVHGAFPHVRVLVHGYDYAIPAAGRWLGQPMKLRNILDASLQRAIVADMIDRFNRGLRRLVSAMPHVVYVDMRNTVREGLWHDELHPKNEGYAEVAGKLRIEIERLSNHRGAASVYTLGGPFGDHRELERKARQAEVDPVKEASQAIGLHVGLNRVDPRHYAGWDGALAGCENDAIAMERLARSQGFETNLLLNEQGTRQAVVAAIEAAAAALEPGGMFLFTVAGHGGRIPDWNRDEVDDGTGTAMDETLCLFDEQLVDDELFLLWTRFREGVRILVVGDTCHSGTQIRFNPFSPALPAAFVADPAMRPRCMPLAVETQTWRQNLDEYRNRTTRDEKTLLAPLDGVVRADVLGLGACQDHQYAMDGPEHGQFTAALLRVWDQGRFRGDYRALRDRVEREINSPLQIPSLDEQLLGDPAFVQQQPFALWPRPAAAVLNRSVR